MVQYLSNITVRPNVDTKYYLHEYDDFLLGNRKSFSSALMSKGQGPHLCAQLLKLIFKYYMHWSPTEIRDKLNQNYIDILRIEPLINRIPCPPEINPKREFYYVAWYLYPETVNAKPPELTIKLYMDVLKGDLVKFPKNYFDGNIGYIRARLLFLTMVKEFLPKFENIESMYRFFASDKGRQAINTYKLNVPLRELYGSSLAYLHDSLPERQRDESLYKKYCSRVRHAVDDTFVEVCAKPSDAEEAKTDSSLNKSNHDKAAPDELLSDIESNMDAAPIYIASSEDDIIVEEI